MAKKSKTQKAKASEKRQAKKAEREIQLAAAESGDNSSAEASEVESKTEEKPKGGFLKRADKGESKPAKDSSSKKSEEKKPKKKRFQFFRDVQAELKRVTWPTRIDVMRWSGVVVVALLFFGIFTAVLDNLIVTPLLVLISGADPSTIDWMSYFSFSETTISGDGADASSASDASSADTSSSASETQDATDTETSESGEAASESENTEGGTE